MRLTSTGGRAPVVGFRDALLQGMAPDGGLYLPIDLPVVSTADLETWRDLPFAALAVRLTIRLLGDEFPAPALARLVGDAMDFPVPTVRLDPRLSILELFHGPTLAFKDFGARFLGRFFGYLLAERGDHATILVATSGDTGSAVARGFTGIPGVRVVVLYPAGGVSPFQEAQMTSIGGNVTAVRVPGVFDDCQRLVKEAFREPALARLHLSSANSINIGRLVPQTFYYVASYLAAAPAIGAPVVFSVPSGNLGNLTAGVLAARMGLPVGRLIAATNANDVLPEYLTSGVFRPRPSIPTLSNAMDVGNPSNFARLERLHGGCADAMRAAILGTRVTEPETRAAIRDAYDRHGRVLDPHGAVAYAAARRLVEAGAIDASQPVIALATAHPAKFADAIREELGFEPPLPPADRGWREWARLGVDLPEASLCALRGLLCNLPPALPV